MLCCTPSRHMSRVRRHASYVICVTLSACAVIYSLAFDRDFASRDKNCGQGNDCHSDPLISCKICNKNYEIIQRFISRKSCIQYYTCLRLVWLMLTKSPTSRRRSELPLCFPPPCHTSALKTFLKTVQFYHMLIHRL